MHGIATLAFAARNPELARAIVVIDVAVVSTRRRDRYLQRLRALPTVIYRDLTTAKERYRLMPNEDEIAPAVLAALAERSFAPAPGGGYTLKFDRESFFGGDGLPVEATIRSIGIPSLRCGPSSAVS
jgi:pimeloyl-ACP methyl ester carboxylesterase